MSSYFTRVFIGLILVYVTLSVIRVVLRRASWFRPWQPAYGWSLFVPFAVIPAVIITLAKRDWTAARNSILLGITFVLVWRYAPDPAFIGYHVGADEITRYIATMPQVAAGRPFEYFMRNRRFQNYVRPADKQRVHEAWSSAQHDYYTARIKADAPGLPLQETRAILGYDNLKPSLREQVDLAWSALQKPEVPSGQRTLSPARASPPPKHVGRQ